MGRGMYKRKIQRQLENQIEMELEPEVEEATPMAAGPLFRVKVTHPSLRMRHAPSANGEEVGLITNQGEYDIFETQGEWGKLDNGNWIMLNYTSKIKDS